MQRLFNRRDQFIPICLVLASFLLYLRTLAPDVVDADGGEFQFAAWNFSFVHPTGYPLYLLVGGIFQHLVPLGNPAYRLNLFTAIVAAFAVAAVYLAATEITHHRGAAIIAALAFAVTRTFWYDANAAETYALNAFFVALLIYLALRWQAEPTAKKFVWFCFTFGLALTHHRTITLWIPIWLIFFFVVAYQSQFRFHPERIKTQLVVFVLALFLPLLLYLYLPLRAPTAPYATLSIVPGHDLILYDNSFPGFINYLLGRVFQYEIGWDAVSVARLTSVPQLLIDQFGMIGAILGVVGFGVTVARQRGAGAQTILWLGGFVVTIGFASLYHIGDIFHYYIPAYLVWAMWIGVAVESVFYAIRNTHYAIRVACSVIFVGMVIVQLASNFSFADRSGETQEREQWTQILSAPIPQNAILISNDRDEMMPLWYLQYVENVRRDVIGLFPLITPAPEHANIGRLTDSVLSSGRPIYFVKAMPGIEVKFNLEAANGLWRVRGHAADEPFAECQPTRASPLRTSGMTVIPEGNALRVLIDWQICDTLTENYTTFVHVLNANGNKIAQGNDHQVGGDYYPTSMWQVGETLRDEQTVNLSSPPSGTYYFQVGMYRASDMEMLGEPIDAGSVEFK